MNQSWMLPNEALNWIEENIPKGSNILEFGSGHGSIRLSENYSVTSVEHDEVWLNVAPVNYIHAPIVENHHSTEVGEIGWYDISIVRENIPSKIDLVIIDGPPGHIGRTGILSIIDNLSNSNWILFDDVDRLPELELCNQVANIFDKKAKSFNCKMCRPDGSKRAFAIINMEV
jgi:hypothetical protein